MRRGKKITTIEGLAEGDALTPVMQAFVDHDAQQCGFCTPGFVVATTHFLQNHPEPESNQLRRVLEPPLKPTAEEIRRGLSGNFCRCGTYEGIRAAVLNGATGGGVPGNGDPFAYTCTADKAEKVVSDYQWPDPRTCRLLGKYISRVDGPIKSSGRAKYTYDYNPAGLLAGRILRCPYAHARITSIDTSAAEKMPGVKAVQIIQKPGTEIFWAGDEVVGVAAVDESTAEDALRAIKVQYEQLPHFVSDAEPPKNIASSGGPISQDDFEDMEDNQVPDEQVIAAIKQNGISFHPDEKYLKDEQESGVDKKVIEALRTAKYAPATASKSPYKKTAVQTQGEPDKAFASAAAVVEGLYGASCITHCCLETHGMAAEWPSDKDLLVHVSTQNLSGIAPQVAEPLDIPAGSIQVMQQYIGGGFGSKFSPDRWGIASAQLSKAAGGKPVKIMLERDSEQEVAGMRPSGFGRVKIAADKDGKLVAWESRSWGTGGVGGGGSPPLPYIFEIPNQRKQHIAISTNQGSARAWRAPNHPQAAVITMCAIEDLAAKMNMDPVEFITRNLELTGPREKIYRDEFPIAVEMMEWKKNWHPRGDKSQRGPIKRGLGTLDPHLGWPRAQQRLRPDHPSRRRSRDQDGHAGSRHRLPHHHHDRRGRHARHSTWTT